ncbi:MAG: hypothetical protein AAF570_25865, partial [Bacteroidota bacterium]
EKARILLALYRMNHNKHQSNDYEAETIGPCPICGRPMLKDIAVNEHHLKPKSLKGRETITLHVICHSKIHSVFTIRELYTHYHTPERIRAHPEMEKFIKWVRKKPPEFRDRNRATNQKKGRNPRKRR